MFQQRKKDYLQRIIEEFFAKLQELIANRSSEDTEEQQEIIRACFDFFTTHLDVKITDDVNALVQKIEDVELLEQYAKLLVVGYQIAQFSDITQLNKVLSIVEYLESTTMVYSWDRNVIREDALRLLAHEQTSE